MQLAASTAGEHRKPGRGTIGPWLCIVTSIRGSALPYPTPNRQHPCNNNQRIGIIPCAKRAGLILHHHRQLAGTSPSSASRRRPGTVQLAAIPSSSSGPVPARGVVLRSPSSLVKGDRRSASTRTALLRPAATA